MTYSPCPSIYSVLCPVHEETNPDHKANVPSRRRRNTYICLNVLLVIFVCLGYIRNSFVLLEIDIEPFTEDGYSLRRDATLLTKNSTAHTDRRNRGHVVRNKTEEDRHIQVKLPPFSREESFSGCILYLDQKHRMTEWIAYHYFALPLRTLFIAYDPKTRDRASDLLERWKNVISIVEWDDEDYLPNNWTIGLTPDYKRKASLATVTHRKRQLRFYQTCHERSVEMGINRTVLFDPDEYLRVNPAVVSPSDVDTSEPGHITKLLKKLEAPNNTLLLSQEGVTYKANCSIYPRVQYTTLGPNRWYKVPSDVEYTKKGLVDSYYFNTLRYRYRNMYQLKHPKGVMNVMDGVPHNITMLHYPLDRHCNKSAHSLDKSLFLINHYIGSFEDFSYAFRNDARNGALDDAEILLKWQVRLRGRGNDHAFDYHLWNPLVRDDAICSWISAFFAWQSDDVAKELLRDTGLKAVE